MDERERMERMWEGQQTKLGTGGFGTNKLQMK
jgi:hypothetical protein